MFKFLLLLFTSLLSMDITQSNMSEKSWSDIANKPKFFSVYDRDETMYSSEALNIRKLPTKDAKKIGVLMKGDKVHIVGYTSVKDWVQIEHNSGVAYVNVNYLVYKKPVEPPKETEKPVEEEKDIELPDFMKFRGRIKNEYVSEILKYWSKIPSSVRSSFAGDGSEIIITSENLGRTIYDDADKAVLAVTVFDSDKGNCKIYISSVERAKTTILHEIGHYIDGKLGYACKGDFEAIWYNELPDFRDIDDTADDNVNTAHEYFAESVYMYILDKSTLKDTCTYTYRYVKNCIRRFATL